MKIYAMHIKSSALDPSVLHTLLTILPLERQKKVARYSNRADQVRTLIADVFVRDLIRQTLHIPFEQIGISTNEYGKPFVTNDSMNGFSFNLSHSGEWIFVGTFHDSIGVDVQQCKKIQLRLADRFFSAEEQKQLLLQPENHQEAIFFRYWACKESYIKYVGKGISYKLSSFTIQLGSSSDIHEVHENGRDTGIRCREYQVDPGYKMAVCAKSISFPEHPIVINCEKWLVELGKRIENNE
ncbi:4'-phosphopantetheinyl transferase family protein [Brevibacillus daliensis]|uniref:4'-phosphopantetheinyl transferase family protein n=1 Tax=Brevibacillus daliensis TaxID=2892995 RepID=UPI001E56E03E|nr:4'-phosphopantetheinyl transferase superfamily protein [Brevibacillus daliensis]